MPAGAVDRTAAIDDYSANRSLVTAISRPRFFLPALVVATLLYAGCASTGSDPIREPSFLTLNSAAPDSFDVEMVTSAGTIELRLVRPWSPQGVDRAYYLFENNFHSGARFYRVVENFVAQFGGSGDVRIDSLWRTMPIADEPVRANNARGTIAYARGGARSRSFTFYINLKDNFGLDTNDGAENVIGFPPIGRVIRGMDVVDSLYSGYANQPMRTDLSASVLRFQYPRLDSIATTRVTKTW
jgi:cyclophilin family peptidyl-prolyl cis-trans isomerase